MTRIPNVDPADLLLYAVTDRAWLRGRSLRECVADAISGGATFVQLREKACSAEEERALALELQTICREASIPFVINDHVELAIELGADGVHVGQSDMACVAAREALGPDAIVGVSAQTVEQALRAQEEGADYLGVGALVPTATKPDAVDVTRDELKAICEAVSIPVVGIGGLGEQTMDVLTGTGVVGAAVVSAIFANDDIVAATHRLRGIMEETIHQR